jgi:hypothetical protein
VSWTIASTFTEACLTSCGSPAAAAHQESTFVHHYSAAVWCSRRLASEFQATTTNMIKPKVWFVQELPAMVTRKRAKLRRQYVYRQD